MPKIRPWRSNEPLLWNTFKIYDTPQTGLVKSTCFKSHDLVLPSNFNLNSNFVHKDKRLNCLNFINGTISNSDLKFQSPYIQMLQLGSNLLARSVRTVHRLCPIIRKSIRWIDRKQSEKKATTIHKVWLIAGGFYVFFFALSIRFVRRYCIYNSVCHNRPTRYDGMALGRIPMYSP